MSKLDPRCAFAVLGLVCIGLLAFGWHVQYGPARQQPCPLCILQRYGYILLGTTMLIGAAFARGRLATLVFAALGEWIALAGAGLAVWQVTKGKDMLSCTSDPVGIFVNGLPMVDWWPEYFFANGGCADVYPPVLGLTVPVWSLIWFVSFSMALSALFVFTLRQRK